MEQIHIPQGSDEWLSARKTYFGASEASAMLGLSPYVTRSELLHRKATGIAKEYDSWFQENVLDHGHAVEAMARPIAEGYIGEELYPLSAKDGRLWVSTDGMNMAETIVWENKQWNGQLADMVSAGFLPEHHQPQCQQALMLTGAERLLFTVSDGTEENTLFLWVDPDPAWFKRLRDGWEQFAVDLAAYVPPPPAAPKPVAQQLETLPALRMLVEGRVIDTNLTVWSEAAAKFIASINRTLTTDQHFADAESAVKWCEKSELRLDEVKSHALSQTETLEQAFRTIDDVKAQIRTVRLELSRLVERRKTEIRTEIVSEATAGLHAHIAALNEELSPYRLPQIMADFGGAIKGKRTVDTLRNAADTELARAKIDATNIAQGMRANLRVIQAESEFAFLFNDAASLLLKDAEAVKAIVRGRIYEHQAEQMRKAEEAAERERARIAAEIEAKLRAEQAAREKAEREAQAARDREAAEERRRQDAVALAERQQAEADLKALSTYPTPELEPSPSERRAETVYSASLPALEKTHSGTTVTATTIFDQSGNGHHLSNSPSMAPIVEEATLNLGALGARWGCVLGSKFLTELGIDPREVVRGSCLYSEGDWIRILHAIRNRADGMIDEARHADA